MFNIITINDIKPTRNMQNWIKSGHVTSIASTPFLFADWGQNKNITPEERISGGTAYRGATGSTKRRITQVSTNCKKKDKAGHDCARRRSCPV